MSSMEDVHVPTFYSLLVLLDEEMQEPKSTDPEYNAGAPTSRLHAGNVWRFAITFPSDLLVLEKLLAIGCYIDLR